MTPREQVDRVVRSGARPAAVLFLGPGRVGKRAAALDLARRWVCREAGDPRCACPDCRAVRAGQHLEVVQLPERPPIDLLRETLAETVWQARRRVIVLPRADEVGAPDVLLKSLEEPSGPTVWIMTARQAPIATIASRAWVLRTGLLTSEEAAKAHDRPLDRVERASLCGQLERPANRLTYLAGVLAGRPDPVRFDKFDADALRADLRLAAIAVVEAVRYGVDRFGTIELPPLPHGRLEQVVDVLDRADGMVGEVRPWLVVEWLRNRLGELT